MSIAPQSIQLATGAVVLNTPDERDFIIDGAFPLEWQRTYISSNADSGLLGPGWTTPLSFHLQLRWLSDKALFIDLLGREITFPLQEVGQAFYSKYEHIQLLRTSESEWELLTPEGVRLLFAPHEADHQLLAECADISLPLQAMVDTNGNGFVLRYNEARLPVLLQRTDGVELALIYQLIADHAPRLGKIQRKYQHAQSSLHGASHTQVLVEYRYNQQGNLIEVLDALGQSCQRFAYTKHVMISSESIEGLIIHYDWSEHSPTGRVTQLRASSGAHWSLQYTLLERMVHITQHHGQQSRSYSQIFDAEQYLIAQVDAYGNTSQFHRDAYSNVRKHIDANGLITRYEYDNLSRLTQITTPDGATQSTTWHASLHKPLAITDALGRTSRFVWDDRGNLLQSLDAAGHATRYQYDQRGLPITITDALGKTKQLQYNARGQLVHYTDCSGQSSKFSWDDEGNLLSSTDALEQISTYAYERINRRQRLVMQRLADDSIERFAYDPAGRLTSHQDALGQITRYQLDVQGKPLVRTNALGHSLRYQYDGFGRLTRLTNENGVHYRFAWDLLDQLQAEQGFDGRRLDYRYNAVGHLLEMADGQAQGSRWMVNNPQGRPANIRTHYQRDAMGRLLQRQVHKVGHGLQRTRYQYDAAGQLTIARNQHARVQLVYSPTGQIISEILHSHLGQHSTLAHQYDALGNRISTRLPDGRSINTLHYGSGHVHQINVDGEVICDFERDALHREVQRSQGALSSHYQLDAIGRLLHSQTVGHQTKADSTHAPHTTTSGQHIARRYQYDEAGQLLGIDDSRHGRTRYRYDAIGRLTQALAGHKQEHFAFDPAHNLIDPQQAKQPDSGINNGDANTNSLQELRQTEWAEYVRAHINDPDFNPLQAPEPSLEPEETAPEHWGTSSDNRLKVWQVHRYQYDQWGNCIEKKSGPRQVQHFTWDAEHQLSSARTQHQGQQEGKQHTWHYAYDPFGRRIAKWQEQAKTLAGKHKKPQPEHITHFSWDGNRLLAEYTQPIKAGGSKQQPSIRHKLYLYEPDSFVPLAQINSTWLKDREARDTPLSNPFLQKITQEAQNDPAIWSGKVLPFQRKLQAKLHAQGIEPDKPKKAIDSSTLYYHTDHLGTPRELTNLEGDIVWTATYKAWGNIDAIEYPRLRQTTRSGNTLQEQWVKQELDVRLQQNLRFQGQYYDQCH